VLAAAAFVALGIGIGTLGTLIGAGGGFILLPVLALLFPAEPTGTLTATSLAVVAANATSGAIAYGRQRRIDVRSGLAFAVATLQVELPLGIGISFVIGFASSLLGIGGGFIHVPALIAVLGFPVHIATATSQFVLAIMATVGTITHLAAGDLADVWPRAAYIALGAVGGAQIGARLSTRVRGTVIVRLLAAALMLVAVRLAAQGLLGI